MTEIQDLVASLGRVHDLRLRVGTGAWLEIAIDRPDKRNALREQTASELLRVLESVESSSAVRAVILHGAQEFFCAGVDVAAFAMPAGGPYEQWRLRRTNRQLSRLFRTLPEFTKPYLVAVEGYALGGGFELAAQCRPLAGVQFGNFKQHSLKGPTLKDPEAAHGVAGRVIQPFE